MTTLISITNAGWDVREGCEYFTWSCQTCGATYQTYSESPHGETECEDCGRKYSWAMAVH